MRGREGEKGIERERKRNGEKDSEGERERQCERKQGEIARRERKIERESITDKMGVCVHLCVCALEREGDRGRDTDRQREIKLYYAAE